MTDRFTKKAQDALSGAQRIAGQLGHTYIGSEHLLLGLAAGDGVAAKLLAAKGADTQKLRDALTERAGIGSPARVSSADLTPCAKRIIEVSGTESVKNGQSFIGTEHLLLAILEERDCVAIRLLEVIGVGVGDLRGDLLSFLATLPKRQDRLAKDRGDTGNGKEPAATLRNFGRDLTELARAGKIDPVIGRDTETGRVIRILSRRTKNNPCLIGEPGVGKTAVVEGLAKRIAEGSVPESLRGKHIYTLDIAGMIAGAKYRGEFEERFRDVLSEAADNTDIILFIDEIHTIVGAGAAEGAVDAANIIKPALARGELRVIGATTLTEYRRHIEKDAALERRFQAVTVEEPSEGDAVRILEGLADRYEAHHRVRISKEAIRAAVTLSKRYLPDRFLPDKAIDLIDEAASGLRLSKGVSLSPLRQTEQELERVRLDKEEAISHQDFESAAGFRREEEQLETLLQIQKEQEEQPWEDHPAVVSADDVAEVVTAWTGIPVNRLTEDDGKRLLHLEETLSARVIGQEDAIRAVAGAVRRSRSGLRDPHRPIGSFLFLGSSGVGKTELSRALADALFNDTKALIRFDMSEFMERHSVSKLIGSPPGYVGFGEGGQLTEQVRRRPYAVVLFDEIEKAHPDVFHLFLQILDDGRLTDTQGRVVDFTNTVIILTSNLGTAQNVSKPLGFSPLSVTDADRKAEESRIRAALKDTFRPEFLNRIDETVVFRRLSEKDLTRIAELTLEKTVRRMAELGITLTFDRAAAQLLARDGSDPIFGARPIRRAEIRLFEDSLSGKLLAGEIRAGDRVLLSAENGSPSILVTGREETGADSAGDSPQDAPAAQD